MSIVFLLQSMKYSLMHTWHTHKRVIKDFRNAGFKIAIKAWTLLFFKKRISASVYSYLWVVLLCADTYVHRQKACLVEPSGEDSDISLQYVFTA